jgi:CheY-like chemotaxis protein
VNLVLLIDDEPGMGHLVEMLLADLEARVIQTANLADALAAATAETPRVVLLDLALEEVDGLEILPDLLSAPALRDVPVIGFSVHDSREPEARQKGVSGFVAKPFRGATLRDSLEPYLG